MSARDLLQSGTKWVIGNGRKVRFWKDAWIPGLPGDRVFSHPPLENMEDSTVAEWRINDGSGWKEQPLRELFTDQEFDAIKVCTVAESNHDDFLSWKRTKNGTYTVRSGYHHEMQRKYGDIGSSNFKNDQWLWKKIWKAGVPSKVKNLVWRAIHNGLPTMVNLAKRGINVDCLCPRCGEDYETMTHMVLSCKESKILWRLSPLRLDLNDLQTDFWEWCDTYARKCVDGRSWEIVMMFIWQTWCMRNRWVFENKRIDPGLTCLRTLSYLGECESAATPEDGPIPAAVQSNQQWQSPMGNIYKLNTDAAMNVNGKVGLGMVVRDAEADVLMSAGCPIDGPMPAIQAEAEAILFGIKYANDAGLWSLDIETDCLNLVDLLQSKSHLRTTTQVIVNDILFVARNLNFCSFRFASRSCNKVAHSLAKAAVSFEETLVWMEDCPPDVLPLVLADKLLV